MVVAPYYHMYIIYIVMLYIKLKCLQNSFRCSKSGVHRCIGFNVMGWATTYSILSYSQKLGTDTNS